MKRTKGMQASLIPSLAFLVLLGSTSVFGGETVKITGVNRIWGDTDGDLTYLEGEIVATQDQTIIYAPRAELNKEAKKAVFSDGVKLVQEEVTITGDELDVDFNRDIGVFTGNVLLVRQEERDEKGEVTKDGIELTCEVLEINTETKDFTGETNVLLRHKDFTVTAVRVGYLDLEETMTFSGGTYLKRDQEEVWGEEIRVDLEKKIFEVRGGVEIYFEVEDEQESKDDDKDDDIADNHDQADAEAVAEAEPEAVAETKPEAEPEAQTKTNTEAEAKAEDDIDTDIDTDTNIDIDINHGSSVSVCVGKDKDRQGVDEKWA